MKKFSFIPLFLSLCFYPLFGLSQDKPSIISHEVSPHWYVINRPGYLTDSSVFELPLTTKDFLSVCKQEFCLSDHDELRIKKGSRFLSTGCTHFQQYYDGYEVESAMVIVESNIDTISLVSAYLIGNLDYNTDSPIAKSLALETALNAINGTFVWRDSVFVNGFCRGYDGVFDSTRYQRLLPKGELCIARKFGTEFEKNNFRFVWKFFIGTVLREYRVLVDANTGELFDVADNTCYSGLFAPASIQKKIS